jgi:hypothetical protein
MEHDAIAERLSHRVRPTLAIRLIPKTAFRGFLGQPDRPYVCLGDYEEL